MASKLKYPLRIPPEIKKRTLVDSSLTLYYIFPLLITSSVQLNILFILLVR